MVRIPERRTPRALAARPVGMAGLPALVAMVSLLPAAASAALLQLSGRPLRGGSLQGSVSLPLERASGGDTPVLTFTTPNQPLRLLLDTGATMTMVLPAAAARLGLRTASQAEAAVTLAGGGLGCGQLRPRRVDLPTLRLAGSHPADGNLRLEGAEALVLAVAALPQGVDGVLGIPSLRQLPFAIDPRAGRIRFGSGVRDATTGREVPAASLPLRWKRGLPLLDLQGPRGSIPALADTGAEGLFLEPELAEQLTPLGPSQSLTLAGVCGAQPVSRMPVLGVGLPGMGDTTASVILTPNPIFRQLGVKAILGQELLGRHRQVWRLDLAQPRLELH